MFLNNNFRFPDCMCADTLELKCPRNEYSFCFYAIFPQSKPFVFTGFVVTEHKWLLLTVKTHLITSALTAVNTVIIFIVE